MRLELNTDSIYNWFKYLFQFHKGAIRTAGGFAVGPALAHFNSIKVRLERIDSTVVFLKLNYFNSIKVRLEPISFLWFFVRPLFQFQKGAIRTMLPISRLHQPLHFNSIKVRLEQRRRREKPLASPFQFHKGAIRTRIPWKTLAFGSLFQFHKGAIRTR